MKFSTLEKRQQTVEKGRWITISELDEYEDDAGFAGLRLKVRGLDNADFRSLETRLRNAISAAKRRKGLSSEKSEELMTRLLHETVLLDWEGLTEDDETTPIPYSREKALEALGFGDFRGVVINAAAKVRDDEKEDGEAVEGNSGSASGGSSPGGRGKPTSKS